MYVVHTHAYAMQPPHSVSVSLRQRLWPLWPLCHVSRTPNDPTRAVMKDESWQRMFYCAIATLAVVGGNATSSRVDPGRFMLVSDRQWETTWAYMKVQPRLESPEYKSAFYGRRQDCAKLLAAGGKQTTTTSHTRAFELWVYSWKRTSNC